ncbi:hypothetical protein AB0M46_44995 [Dactylosporangium sp. NPDC051485]|uniref:hypothetical protein n=1 Tax=Dactylosporangium sp. NPDC051485 TaxID=3154846 RepID=UPI003442C580
MSNVSSEPTVSEEPPSDGRPRTKGRSTDLTPGDQGNTDAEPAERPSADGRAEHGADAARDDGSDRVHSGEPAPAGADDAKPGGEAAGHEDPGDTEPAGKAPGDEKGRATGPAAAQPGEDEPETGKQRRDEDGGEQADEGKDAAAASKEPADPFTAFAPEPEFVPSRFGRITRRTRSGLARFFAHEWTLAALGSVLLAAIMTWPALQYPATTIPQDIWDPTLQAWQMSWAGHILTTDPLQLWQANAFYPDQYTYAFSDTLLGYAPAGMIGSGPVAAIVRYNIIFVLIFAFAFFGAYALARQLGTGRTGAAVAGAAFAYAPWRLGQAGHLHVLSIGGIALALAMLARGHGFSLRRGYEPEKRRWGWVLAGWLVAAWQISLGFGIGIPFAYALLTAVLASAVTWGYKHLRNRGAGRRPFGWKLLLANLGGGLVFVAVSAMMAYPYLQVLKQHQEAKRSADIIGLFSPPLKGLFISPPESWLWGDAYANARSTLGWAPEMALLPGFFLYGLAFAGLFVSIWRLQHRLLLGVGAVGTAMLAMGTNGPGDGDYGYLALYRMLPGFEGIRTSGRLMVWVTLFLALLAAGAVSAFAERAVELFADRTQSDVRDQAGVWRIVTLIPLLLVLAEGVHQTGPNHQMGPNPTVPPAPVAMSTVQGPVMVLPSSQLFDMNVMLWSTDGFPKMVNGGSGFTPSNQEILRLNMEQFPDQATVTQLREMKIRTVVVLRDEAAGTPYARAIDAPIDGLGITRTEQGDVITYKIDG